MGGDPRVRGLLRGGEHIVARTRGDVAFVTIDPAGAVEPLELPLDSYAWLMVPAAVARS
jgi:hypothetical protein